MNRSEKNFGSGDRVPVGNDLVVVVIILLIGQRRRLGFCFLFASFVAAIRYRLINTDDDVGGK